jgi:phospholipase C
VKSSFRILLFVAGLAAVDTPAQISSFQHIIVVFQENRTPDNLFYTLCASSPCSTNPDGTQYNIKTSDWLDKSSSTGVTQPTAAQLANGYDLDHTHTGWKNECDLNTGVNPPQCRMDGAYLTHANRGAYIYVNNTVDTKHPLGILTPYLTLATTYGWANFMFQTNQGPSFPAHQFIFGGTSALDAAGDAAGTFLSENFQNGPAGCYAQDGETTKLINSAGKETTYKINYATGVTTCLTRPTMPDLIPTSLGWKYYSTKAGGTDRGGSIWTAPNAIQAICVPDSGHQNCTGSIWAQHVDLTPADVLNDLGMNKKPCNLQGVNWVIPAGGNSDHPGGSSGGPDWVASIVNALGQSPCKNPDGTTYWNTTAVVITWDDFGGCVRPRSADDSRFARGRLPVGVPCAPDICVGLYSVGLHQ